MSNIEKKEVEFGAIYTDKDAAGKRYESLKANFGKVFAAEFGTEEAELFSAPGRTEIVGNHTDHNGGKVLAASIDMDTLGAAHTDDSGVIRIVSEGYAHEVVIDLKDVKQYQNVGGTTALVAGMVEAVQEFGHKVGGFHAYVSTTVIPAAGVSSSASFEMLVCAMINHFFNENSMTYTEYARIGQYAENHYWFKASGLMDQMACAVGGPIMLDFSEEGTVHYEHVDFAFEQYGYKLVIVNTGKGHADLSAEYSSIPEEMKSVAVKLGVKRLCETNEEALLAHLSEMENDRAVMRAFHFFEENKRVEKMADVVKAQDGEALLSVIKASGDSSWEWLQNCYTSENPQEQKITLALALTELFFRKNESKGICRVHGGGFAGVIAAIVPKDEADSYVEYIGGYMGAENVYPVGIRMTGAVHLI